MKEEKTKTKRRGLYYILLVVSVLLLAAATVLTVYFATNDGNDIAQTPPATDGGDEPDEPDQPDEPDEPTGGETLYVAPVAADGYAVEFNAVYANTLTGFYYRHQGVDFTADAGAEVYAVADGTITSVSMSEELGNLITVDHGDGLVSCYRFVEPQDGLKAGDKVEQGGVLGKVASPYGTEAHGGAHLHFELALDGESVDPADHLDLTYEEK